MDAFNKELVNEKHNTMTRKNDLLHCERKGSKHEERLLFDSIREIAMVVHFWTLLNYHGRMPAKRKRSATKKTECRVCSSCRPRTFENVFQGLSRYLADFTD